MHEKVIKKLQKLTGHKHIRITDRGNSAIFAAMLMAKRLNPKLDIVIPDQGGWYSYKRYPTFFGFKIREVQTNYGLIDLKSLKHMTKDASCFIYTPFAGYFAEQDVKKIYEICNANECMVIMDASGCIGDKKLCDGRYADIILGSFGKWKPINLGYGGFITSHKPDYFGKAKEAFSMIKVCDVFYKDILPFLNDKRLKKILALSQRVKKDLEKYEILHRDKRGLNVVVKFNPEIIEYCQKHNYEYVLCPNYIRVNEKAISIELKRLDL